MRQVTHKNYQALLKDGGTLFYGGGSSYDSGCIVADDSYNGGFHINGRSVVNILDESYEVLFMWPMSIKES